jgi:hypothetical protein
VFIGRSKCPQAKLFAYVIAIQLLPYAQCGSAPFLSRQPNINYFHVVHIFRASQLWRNLRRLPLRPRSPRPVLVMARMGVISCGSVYCGFGTVVNLGWEPQWILMKQTAQRHSASDWVILADTMRGIPTGSQDALLFANTSGAETSANYWIDLTSTGFVT